jgi:2-methylcitrate dehydratase PrpD
VFVGDKAPADKAAFVNGVSLHGLEMDDSNTQAGGHPAGPVISAAMAVAEEDGASGLELIRAVIWGYDMMVRVARAAVPDHSFEPGWHPTAIYGIFGAVVAAAHIRKLTPAQLVSAIGIAGGFAAGNLECYADNSFTKRLNPGHAAMSAVNAVNLAKAGYIGPRWMIEGAHGFLKMYTSDPMPERFLEKLDYTDYPIMYTAFKPYASCRYTHAPIDGVLKIRKERGLAPEEIDRITVDTVSMAIRAVVEPRELKYNPDNIAGAQFSLPYTVACAALFGAVSVEQFTEELLHDKELKAMMDRVEMVYTKKMDAYLPTIFASEVTIRTKKGDTYSEIVTFTKGDPEAPITPPELKEKFLSLARRNISEEQALKIYDCVFGLDKLNVADMTALF